jgi:hypothetical protein
MEATGDFVSRCLNSFHPYLDRRPSFEDTIINELSNSRRRVLLQQLLSIAVEQGDIGLRQWCHEHEDAMLLSLRSITAAEVGWVIQVATDRSWEFLRDS